LNLPSEAIVGRLCHELFNPGGGPCPGCPVPRVLDTNQSATAEIKCGSAGSLFEITVSPVTNPQGQITHFVHIARDLREKKELEAELRHAQKMEAVGTLAGGIAHDFNNLLTVVLSCAEMIVTDEAEAGRHNENLEPIVEAAKRGAQLTKQLLLFSRKQSPFNQKRPLDLNEVLKNIMQMLEKGLSKSVSQHYRLAADLQPINADAGQLEQIVMNLAVNAAHAMPAGGTLTIETQNLHLDLQPAAGQAPPGLEPGDYVLLSVSDTGSGMDQTTLAHIYEPFFTTKNVGQGSGLGLAVVFGIVREHQGQISCHSELAAGTTFRIYFPAVRQPAGEAQPAPAKPSVLPGGSETILVVDDEASIRALLGRHLTRQGYAVITAADGEIALRQYTQASRRPQAVILDLGMPNMSGWECLEKLRDLDPLVRVLVASGYGVADLETNALKAGASAFLGKPYNLALISRKLREILDSPRHPATL
jgi:signal transduction histidine kinase/CheY-like chemotaxis protein